MGQKSADVRPGTIELAKALVAKLQRHMRIHLRGTTRGEPAQIAFLDDLLHHLSGDPPVPPAEYEAQYCEQAQVA